LAVLLDRSLATILVSTGSVSGIVHGISRSFGSDVAVLDARPLRLPVRGAAVG
jgi:hypothetical protein